MRDQAAVMLAAEDTTLVHEAAVTLSQLGMEIVADVDASLLVGHPLHVVQEFAAFIAAKDPVRYSGTLERLTVDPDRRSESNWLNSSRTRRLWLQVPLKQ